MGGLHALWLDNRKELFTIIRLSVPVSMGFLLNKLVAFVSVVIVGHLGPAELAAAALGSSLTNVVSNSVMQGLAGAMSTLCGQAYGAKNYDLVGHVWQRAMIILGLVCIPICGMLLAIEKLLLLGGQTAAVAAMTAAYVRWSLPGVWAYAAFITANNYLQAQNIVQPQVITSAIVLALHLPLNLLCIYTLGLGYRGAGLATSISLWLQFVMLLGYILFMKKGESTWPGWSRACLVDWFPFVKLAIPSVVLISEWWASEGIVMMGGLLPDAQRQLSAMAIYQTTSALCFTLPMGIAIAVLTRVSNELGAGNARTAQHTTSVGLVLTFIVTTCLSIPMLIFRMQWAELFSEDPGVAALIAQNLVVLAFYIAFDGLSSFLGGVISGAGKQLAASPCVLVSYYIIGLPGSALFAFTLGWGSLGLCLGTTVGTAAHAAFFYFIVWRLDWDREARRAAARVTMTKAIAMQSVMMSTEGDMGHLQYGFPSVSSQKGTGSSQSSNSPVGSQACASEPLAKQDLESDRLLSE